jgi:hypothetical protein
MTETPDTSVRGSAGRLALLLIACLWSFQALGQTALRPHEIVYETSFKGIGAGNLRLTLTAGTTPNSWVYETRAMPNFLASFVVSADAHERSWFLTSAAGVVPQRYLLESSERTPQNNTRLTYDWDKSRVTGQVEDRALDLPIPPSLQDVMSIRLAPTVDLLAGREPREYPMLDGREIKYFVYTRAGNERLKTALGEVDTEVFTSLRKGADASSRSWRYWYAPSLGWLPVRIEQRERGATRLVFKVRSLRWL